ncbi:response regulator [Candidatus Nitrosotalea bavarica]|uniref:response regulator n=1 Tax=Candidatus Nitrosotalea bavarica TaxID=1903277 RepID=UPI001FEAB899|nr:response regulator [Candidatus Nitrosotalea bavarica]
MKYSDRSKIRKNLFVQSKQNSSNMHTLHFIKQMVSYSQPYPVNDKNSLTATVIDDDKGVVSILSDFLQIKGIQVIGKGYDGSEAVETYKKLRPDVVFLDVLMERYDGFYAFEKIRKIQPDAAIIMMTSDSSDIMREKLFSLNASAIIYKPYDIDEIVHVLNKISPVRAITL